MATTENSTSEVQLMADGCVALLKQVFGDTNWSRWNEVKYFTQFTDFQEFVSWLLDVAQQQLAMTDEKEFIPDNTTSSVEPDYDVEYVETSDFASHDDVKGALPSHESGAISHAFSADFMPPPFLAGDGLALAGNCLQIHRQPNNYFFCSQCKVSLNDIVVVEEHRRLRHPDMTLVISCHCCLKTFPAIPEYIQYHKETGKSGKSSLICDYCAKKFSRRQKLDDHVNSKHLKLGPSYECNNCGNKFSHKSSLFRHRKICLQKAIQSA